MGKLQEDLDDAMKRIDDQEQTINSLQEQYNRNNIELTEAQKALMIEKSLRDNGNRRIQDNLAASIASSIKQSNEQLYDHSEGKNNATHRQLAPMTTDSAEHSI